MTGPEAPCGPVVSLKPASGNGAAMQLIPVAAFLAGATVLGAGFVAAAEALCAAGACVMGGTVLTLLVRS